jgi:hypothetical protein
MPLEENHYCLNAEIWLPRVISDRDQQAYEEPQKMLNDAGIHDLHWQWC